MSTKNIFFLCFTFFFTVLHSQTINLTTNNLGCKNSGIVNVATIGITSPNFQLQLSDGTVIAPVAGNNSAFSSSNVFSSLPNGIYKVIAKDNFGMVYISSNISVSDGYTDMFISANSISLPCVGATVSVPVTLSGGKPPFIYEIYNTSSSAVIETSLSTSNTSYSFSAMPTGNYSIKVTDACFVTKISNLSINNPTITLNQVVQKAVISPSRSPSTCGVDKIRISLNGFKNQSNNVTLSQNELALFSIKLKYLGELYGMDTNGDNHSDTNGGAYNMNTISINIPLGVTRENLISNIATTKIVLLDQCGDSKELNITLSNGAIGASTNCLNGSTVQAFVGPSMVCFPINYVFTNTSNPSDVISVTQTINGQSFSGFTAGKAYTFTHTDANGSTTNFFGGQYIYIPGNTATLNLVNSPASIVSLNYLNYGTSPSIIVGGQIGLAFNYVVTASNNPLVSVGTTGSGTSGNPLNKVNASDPNGFWPKGTYALTITNSCGTGSITLNVEGRTATLSGNTINPVCAGFDYSLQGNFDVIEAYEVVIISGPSNVGLTKDLVSTTSSMIFPGLSYGNYIVGLRIKGGTANVLTQSFNYGVNGVITINKNTTGGFVCTSGGNDGSLTINANTISPAPNNVLQYRISLDGGNTYQDWQNSNVFNGLTNTTYFFQVKDGCNFTVTDNSQIGSIANPQASSSFETICELQTDVTLQLNVDTSNANYLWTGPGINSSNQNEKNPVLNLNTLNIGQNNYTVTVNSSFCNTISQVNTTITKIAATKPASTTGTELNSLVGIGINNTDGEIDKIKNGALVLKSANNGFVITRLQTNQLPSGANAIKGMLVFDIDENCLKLFNGFIWKCISRVCL